MMPINGIDSGRGQSVGVYNAPMEQEISKEQIYEMVVRRAVELVGGSSRLACHLCALAFRYQTPGLPAVAGLRLDDILPLPISAPAPPVARGCRDYETLLRILVGVNLRTQYRRAVREIVQDPDEYGKIFSCMNSPAYRATERSVADELLAKNRGKTIAELLMLNENMYGFYEFDPADPQLLRQWQSPEATVRQERGQGITEEVGIYHDPDETGTLDIRFVWARSYRGEMCIATAMGYLAASRRPGLADVEFYSACEQHSERLTEFSYYALLQHGSAENLFRAGDVFYLRHWEVAKAERGKGLGASLLNATLRAIADRHKGIGSIAVDLAPGQYTYPLPSYCPPDVRARYESDRRKLRAYWERLQPHRLLAAPQPQTLHLTMMHALTRQDEKEILRHYCDKKPHQPYH